MGRTNSHSFSFLAFALLLLHFQCLVLVVSQELPVAGSETEALELAGSTTERETLEIIIGGGGGGVSSPAPSPGCPLPPPPPRPLSRLDKAQRVLLKFKKLIYDPNCYTQNWNEQTETCKFNGILCDTYPNTSEKAVAGIDLNTAGISGLNGAALPLTGILDSIPELTFFHVNSNNFSSSVPNIKFPFFFELDLSNNKLLGEFPKDVLQSNLLVFLDLRFNSLQGVIPSELFQMDLDVIFINNNLFSGCLPENFGLTPARFLTVANNQLTGSIPKSIGKAAKTLTQVLFLGNKFDGCLPFEIGYLKKATIFDVSRNLLTGPIPYSFGCLEKIQLLNLAHNKFYGVVPDSVCRLPGIRNDGNLSLADNYFTGIGQSCWSLIKSKVLDVSNNCIPGLPNQRSHKECYEFQCKVKPCANQQSLKYIPCKPPHWGEQSSTATMDSPSEPVTYKTLNPHHRLRL